MLEQRLHFGIDEVRAMYVQRQLLQEAPRTDDERCDDVEEDLVRCKGQIRKGCDEKGPKKITPLERMIESGRRCEAK